ncbi:S8 family peptidase [Aquimarina rhabdastrellae]
MKKIGLFAIGLAMVCASCSQDEVSGIENQQEIVQNTQKLLSIDEVNKFIEESLKNTGDVDWTTAPTQVLWSAIVHSKDDVTIGFGNEGESFSLERTPELRNTKNQILTVIADQEQIKSSDMTVKDDEILNYMMVAISKYETIAALQKTEGIRYIEPNGYSFYLENDQTRSSAGCGESNQTINGADYRIITPNSWVPWSFDKHNIPSAWGYSTGSGITVGVIDTGLSGDQRLMNSDFNDGYSNGRTVQRFGTFNNDGVNDKCGHGTSMSSVIASPRNDDAMPLGVAYNSNLIVYRATSDVVLNGSDERRGVSNALRGLGNNSNVKIISMSIGYPWSIGNIKDAVKYAYSRGKLIIAAGGTSTSFTNWFGVIFPANMSETVAVTGIKDNGKYDRCDVCHSGSKIDFTIVMQRNSNNSRTVPVLGFRTGTRSYVGGSSIATATTAGIAALVWSRNPTWSRSQVLNKLKTAGEFYPNKDGSYGYGNIDALKAVK